jgi:hypothetical protein
MPDPFTALTVGASLLGGAMSSSAASSAADTQAGASRYAADLQKQMFDKQVELQQPFHDAGVSGINRLTDLLGLSGNTGNAGYGSLNNNFSMSDFQADPGYAFRLNEGLRALDRTASARGGLLSGGALKAATNYGQNAASQEYTNAFNRYQVNRANQLDPLYRLFGAGQASANQIGNAGQTYATQAGDAVMGGANARASGYIGSANAWNSALGNIANTYNQNQLLQRLIPSASQPNDPAYAI